MNRQNVIVVIAPILEVWGNFKKLCEAKGFDILPYHSLITTGWHKANDRNAMTYKQLQYIYDLKNEKVI